MALWQCQQAVEAQMSSLEPSDDGFVGFMDAETATFASRIHRLMRSKVEELQTSSPGLDSGMLTPMPEAAMCAAWMTQYIQTDRQDDPASSMPFSWQSCCPDVSKKAVFVEIFLSVF